MNKATRKQKIEKMMTAEEVAAWEAANALIKAQIKAEQEKEYAAAQARRDERRANEEAARAVREATATERAGRGERVTMRSIYFEYTKDFRHVGSKFRMADGTRKDIYDLRRNGAHEARRLRFECENAVQEGLLCIADQLERACTRFERPKQIADLPLADIATEAGLANEYAQEWIDRDVCRGIDWELHRIEQACADMRKAMQRMDAARELGMAHRMTRIIKQEELRVAGQDD